MRRWELKLFGVLPIVSITQTDYEYVGDDESGRIEAGSAHNFERDFEPLSPTSHHEWEWEDKQKGFGFG